MTLAVAPAVDRQRLFFVLICAVVGQQRTYKYSLLLLIGLCRTVSLWRGESHSPSSYKVTLGLLEICASAKRSIGPTLHPVQALKNHLRLIRRSTILDHIRTRFLGGVTYMQERLICEYTVSQKKRANFETVYLEIIRIDFDDIWQKHSKCSRIEFPCFSFRVGLLSYHFSSFKLDTENNAYFENYASHCLSTWLHSVKKTKF